MKTNLYCYTVSKKRGVPTERLRDAAKNAAKEFKRKFGYWPRVLLVRDDECVGMKGFPIPIVKQSKNLPRGHFKYGPVIDRKPVLDVERIAWQT